MINLQDLFLFSAAALGSALNSVAGGGSFIALPALLFTGLSPVLANTTSTIALWPGSVASAVAYRKEIKQPSSFLLPLAGISLLGGTLGAGLLLKTSDTTFIHILPWLMLFAVLMFTFGGYFVSRVRQSSGKMTSLMFFFSLILQFIISIYGGYFGGGMGILMLAAFSLMGLTKMHEMNGLKSALGAIINGAAVIAFIFANSIAWRPGMIMILGAILGGYFGAWIARQIDPKWVKKFVLVIGWGMTVFFFSK